MENIKTAKLRGLIYIQLISSLLPSLGLANGSDDDNYHHLNICTARHAFRTYPETSIDACLRVFSIRAEHTDVSARTFEPPHTNLHMVVFDTFSILAEHINSTIL